MIKKYNDIIILITIWIISITSIIIAITESNNFNIRAYFGYSVLIILSILRFYRIKRFKIYLGVFLLLGLTGLLQFSQFFWTTSFGLSASQHSISSIQLHIIFLILILFFIITNLSRLSEFFADISSDDALVKDERQKRRIDTYYDELINEKDEFLQNIIDNREIYQQEYYRAALKIQEERKT